ncbi:hypothetical protein A3Q56_01924 [Intoshia linei]|uniref:Uncharacterized protein n=1 Tax=Intoshia linei TaxID=1819745 RepID=A0A177B9T5_9BILA|nr:hypothetical protein A3Q56_01924 [Intoshia linei]
MEKNDVDLSFQSEHRNVSNSDDNYANFEIKNLKSDVLSCPKCMTIFCYECKKLEIYPNLYKSISVFNCDLENDKQIKKNEWRDVGLFQSTVCRSCDSEIGYRDGNEVYYFFNVIKNSEYY